MATDRARRLQYAASVDGTGLTRRIDQNRERGGIGHQLEDQLQSLCAQLSRDQADAGDISAWPVETVDKTNVDGIAADNEYDRYRRCPPLCRKSHDIAPGRRNDCDATLDQSSHQFGKAIILTVGPPVVEDHVLARDVATFCQSPVETCEPVLE